MFQRVGSVPVLWVRAEVPRKFLRERSKHVIQADGQIVPVLLEGESERVIGVSVPYHKKVSCFRWMRCRPLVRLISRDPVHTIAVGLLGEQSF